MDKETILNYVTETPGNTNRAVLESMLDSMGEGSEKFIVTFSLNDNEWSADKTLQEVFDAWNSGKKVFGAKYTGMGYTYFPLTEASAPAVTFTYIYGHASNAITIETFTLVFTTSGVVYHKSILTDSETA